jgi:glycosyltransferase involved in cell wall biosynthesis
VTRPLVSVAVLTYNQRELVADTLESVLSQDYPRLEIVVGDDGSRDGTQELIAAIASRHPRTVKPLLARENAGITVNSNRILQACSGELVAWLGGDDLFLPGKISRQVDVMDQFPDAAISYHAIESFDGETGRPLGIANDREPQLQTVHDLLRRVTFWIPSSVMHRRSAAPAQGFHEQIRYASDWLFWIETALAGPIVWFEGVWARYRIHDAQLTGPRSKNVQALRDDLLQTLEIVDAQYPQLRPSIPDARWSIHLAHAMRQRRAGAGRGPVLRSLARAIRSRPWHPGGWRLVVGTLLGARTVRAVRSVAAPQRRARRPGSRQSA